MKQKKIRSGNTNKVNNVNISDDKKDNNDNTYQLVQQINTTDLNYKDEP